ncbi:hypothetical protein BB050_01345 [Flavobacterium anhuiense]|uniref:Uncharacterized protein n=2 Tax=Flavobacterium anhuiense TaxID=459526 RepID=A0AAC9GIR3_9FLAO|nr:hypothetical protein BB050_01345 [Flavobacterium anhuiense]
MKKRDGQTVPTQLMNNMKKISDFFANNWAPLVIGFFCFGVYIYFALAGNRICDCETTENYKSTTSGSRSSYNHFYHK